MASALLKIPIAVAVDATKFYNYKSGVFSDCSTKPLLNHAFALVGMTSEYWLAKEQWGVKWGENGFIKITKSGSACGVCLLASFPVWNKIKVILLSQNLTFSNYKKVNLFLKN